MMVRAASRCLTASIALVIVGACASQPPTPQTTVERTGPSPTSAVASATPNPAKAVATVAPLRPTRTPAGAPAEESMPSAASTERDGIKLTIDMRGAI